jgi:ABC-type uncharacterized transport system permease subunit
MNISTSWGTTGNIIAVGASATYIFKVGLWLKSSKLWLGTLANGLTARLFSVQTEYFTDLTKTGAVISNMTLNIIGKQISVNIQKQLSTLYGSNRIESSFTNILQQTQVIHLVHCINFIVSNSK